MAKQQFLLSSAIGFGLSMGLLYSTAPLAEITFDDYELAQGDGDPQETALEEVSANNMNETAIEENIVSDSDDPEENVATITAEGDFLVPTYLLPVEEEPQDVLTTSENEEIQPQSTNDVSVTKTVKTTTTITTTTEELPIFDVSTDTKKTAISSDTIPSVPVVDVSEKDETATGVEQPSLIDEQPTQVKPKPAAQTPHYIGSGYTGTQKQNTPAVTVPETPQKPAPQTVVTPAPIEPKTPVLSVQPERPILVPLAPLPKTTEPEPTIEPHVRKVVPSEYADKMLTAVSQNVRPEFIMPQEIKVSFYKNASEFSGQTIKWIKAFSVGALNDPRLIVQVRLSVQNPAVQQKRLSVVRNTLIGAGLSPHQIQIVFTNRPADSLILRLMDKPEATSVSVRKSKTGRRVEKRTTKW